jgi:hypothetical protein
VKAHETLAHGSPQRFANLANSLTTTSGVVATLNSILAGSLASDVSALIGQPSLVNVIAGTLLSLVSAVLHVNYAARFRARHDPAA